ncbi:Phosphorelay protein [Hirschfeldia incana]|nr:Phosphorelay protein [Hirschfeldia incana]
MDAKALAKSKRAHTQHHAKKTHPLHKPKGAEKGQVNQAKNPVQSRRVSDLPSNSDRYDDESDLGLLSTDQPTDAIVPKSKGADYLHLISEAQTESHSKIESGSDCLSSLDDLLHDEFSRVVGSMISARGEGMLSWMEDDNFIVEEDGTASYNEPGFLSLDLNALETMLEKVEVHERLYIEADVLPPELCTSQDAEAVTKRLGEPVQEESSGKIDPESSSAVKDIQILTDQPEKSSAIEADFDFLLDSLSEEPNHVAGASTQNYSVQRSSGFETELDSLLSSHGGGAEPLHGPANLSDQKLNATGFGDMLDDLLESTSVSTKSQEKQTPLPSTVGKSKVIEEFDSWLDTI